MTRANHSDASGVPVGTFTDIPIQEKKHDCLGMAKYADALGEFISNCEPPLTVAVHGEWGCGKTSLLQLIQVELREKKVDTLWFNTWQYGQLDLGSTLPLTLLKVLLRHINGDQAPVDSLMRFQKAALTLGDLVVGGALVAGREALSQVGLGPSGSQRSKEVADKDDEVFEISQLRARLQSAVQKHLSKTRNSRLVIFVDDLDRLQPARAVELLEVMKVFLDLPDCVFVLAVDHSIITSGVRSKYPEATDETGRRFFDKLIQLPFVMPESPYEANKKFICRLLSQFEPFVPEIESDINIYSGLVETSIGFNPRGLKRIFNAFAVLAHLRKSQWESEKVSPTERRIESTLLFGSLCASFRSEPVYKYLSKNVDLDWFTDVEPDELEADSARLDFRKACSEANVGREEIDKFLEAMWEAAQDRGTSRPSGDDVMSSEPSERAFERLKSALRWASLTTLHTERAITNAADEHGLRFHGKTLVKTFKKQLLERERIRVSVRRANGNENASDEATLASLRLDPAVAVDWRTRLKLDGRYTVEKAEKLIAENLGLTVRILDGDGADAERNRRLAAVKVAELGSRP